MKQILFNLVSFVGAIAILPAVCLICVLAWRFSPSALYALIAFALGITIYFGMGGRSLFPHPERPERVADRRIRFSEPNWMGSNPPHIPNAIINSYDGEFYTAQFEEPLHLSGTSIREVQLRARHVGYPLSGVSKRGFLAVTGKLENDVAFLSLIRLVK